MKVHDLEDTIAAIATPCGEGGVGIIRISGTLSLKTAEKIFQPRNPEKKLKPYSLRYGEIHNPLSGQMVDEVLVSYMKAPCSFTREDVVEINCHGGTLVLQSIMEILIREGIREASPGEFTKRAFLNGRLDLSQAEAVIDIIRAKTEQGLRIANNNLKGGLKSALIDVKADLLKILALIEAYIDFPEEDIDTASLSDINKGLTSSCKAIKELIDTYEEGRIYREGIHVVIAGRPNVGKSSLLNAILKEKRAIVTSSPGTTRDTIQEIINIKGIPVNLVDTAGIRETADEIEGEGIKRAREKMRGADIVLYMVDDSGITKDDHGLIESDIGGPIIIVINKIDVMDEKQIEALEKDVDHQHPLALISTVDGSGLEALKETLYNLVTHHGSGQGPSVVISNKRHKVALEKALEALVRAHKGIDSDSPHELLAIEIKEGLTGIGELAGETTPDDVLESIFNDFCIGK